MFKPKGIVIPVVTPIDDDGNFLETEYKKLLQYFIDNGIHGVFPFGTSGEFYAFDNGFYRHVLEVTAEYARGKMDIYAGANHITPKGAIELAKIAEDVKVDALSVLTPMFVSQTQKEVEIYYRKIADATSLPIVIYNNKPKTNVTVEPATIRELAKVKNIIAVYRKTIFKTERFDHHEYALAVSIFNDLTYRFAKLRISQKRRIDYNGRNLSYVLEHLPLFGNGLGKGTFLCRQRMLSSRLLVSADKHRIRCLKENHLVGAADFLIYECKRFVKSVQIFLGSDINNKS